MGTEKWLVLFSFIGIVSLSVGFIMLIYEHESQLSHKSNDLNQERTKTKELAKESQNTVQFKKFPLRVDKSNEWRIIDFMDGYDFEYWCAKLLKSNGFHEVRVTSGSNDKGVDILAKKDDILYAIQCKCYSSDLGSKPIQEVYTRKEVYRCHVGVVMTNSYFTRGAIELADVTRTLLWNRDKLKAMFDKMNED